MILTHFSNVTNTSHLSHQSHLSHLRQFLPVVVTVVTAVASMLGKVCLGPPFNSDNSLLGSWKKSRHVSHGAMVPWCPEADVTLPVSEVSEVSEPLVRQASRICFCFVWPYYTCLQSQLHSSLLNHLIAEASRFWSSPKPTPLSHIIFL